MKFLLMLPMFLGLMSCTGSKSSDSKPEESSSAIIEVSKLDLNGAEALPDTVPVFVTTDLIREVSTNISLKNSGSTSFLISNLKISLPSSGFVIKINRCGTSIAPKASCQITVSFSNRALFNNTYNGVLEINQSVLQLQATVSGMPDPDTSGTPFLQLTLSAPFLPLGNPAYRTLLIKNIGTGTAKNVLVSLPALYEVRISRCSSNLKPQESCEVQVLYINSRLNNTPPASIIQVSASGIAEPVKLVATTGIAPPSDPLNSADPFISQVITHWYTPGYFSPSAGSLILDDGSFLVGGTEDDSSGNGSRIFITKYSSNRVMDPFFGVGGRIYIPGTFTFMKQMSGYVYIMGSHHGAVPSNGEGAFIKRMNGAGLFDSDFGNQEGIINYVIPQYSTNIIDAIVQDDSDNLIFSVTAESNAVSKIVKMDPYLGSVLAESQEEPSFSDSTIHAQIKFLNGKIIYLHSPSMNGWSTVRVLDRFFSDDFSFNSGQPYSFTNMVANQLYLNADGSMIIAGKDFTTNKITVFKLSSEGLLDFSFAGSGIYQNHLTNDTDSNYSVVDMKVVGNHPLLLLSHYQVSEPGMKYELLRLGADGFEDPSFNGGVLTSVSRTTTRSYSLSLEINPTDGTIYIFGGGYDSTLNDYYDYIETYNSSIIN
jgi:hypothetical protein